RLAEKHHLGVGEAVEQASEGLGIVEGRKRLTVRPDGGGSACRTAAAITFTGAHQDHGRPPGRLCASPTNAGRLSFRPPGRLRHGALAKERRPRPGRFFLRSSWRGG